MGISSQAASAFSPDTTLARSVASGAGGLLFALWLHWTLWPIRTPDVDTFLLPWYRHILAHGPIGAFSEPFSNYTPPYLYLLALASRFDGWADPFTLIKLLSVAGSGFLALAVHALLRGAGAARPRLGAALAFILPTVAVNAAGLGQCDALWAGACVWAVAEAIRGRTRAMLIWCGVAVALKAQAVFLAPFVLGVLLARRAPPLWWLIPPAVFMAAMLPALLAGWPLIDILLVYPRQASWFSSAGNAANPWVALRAALGADAAPLFPIGYLAAFIAAVTIIIRGLRERWSGPALIQPALLSALALPWLLPKMHERYFLLADVLAFALAWTVRTRPTFVIAAAVQFASLCALFSYWAGRPGAAIGGGVVAGLALLQLLRLRPERLASDDAPVARGLRRSGSARPQAPG